MELPIPDSNALEHSVKVEQYIKEKIQQSGGAIPFSEYMEHVLYAPGLGYYSAGCTKFGEFGDFITAPEISPLFSRCVARAILPVLNQLTNPDILEVGAGSGKMAADILNELASLEVNFDHYYILERSAELRERQQQTISESVAGSTSGLASELLGKVQWLDSLPTSFSGVVVANELLDAMPVQQFKTHDKSIVELHVAIEDEKFVWQEVACENSRLATRVANIQSRLGFEFCDDYQSEINFAAEDWLSSVNDILEQGYILLIDYGYPEKEYYHEQRAQGTLSCFYQHLRHDDPFIYPGLQDLTAHIDFSNLAAKVLNGENNSKQNAGTAASPGLQLDGYTTQSQFLMASGLMDMMQGNDGDSNSDVKQQLIVSQQVKKLTMPYEMGETVKVIGFEKGLSELSEDGLPCFSIRDLRYQL